jgi:flagellar protein FliS
MTNSMKDQYLETRVMAATPVELVRMLYGALIQAVGDARRHLAAGDIAARSRQISRAVEIVLELSGSLDRDKGGELARNLVELYDYIQRRLLEANVRQEDAPLAEALGLLHTMSEAWAALPEGARQEVREERQAIREEDAPAAGYGVFAAPQGGYARQYWSA